MARALVIVESVAKATRIQGMLGPEYIVKPSIGHIRDLPQSAADIPASVKGEKWARLGINVEDHFKPVYVVSNDRKKIVAELKAALKEVDELYLATDEDREGEAIAWHLQEVLNPKVPVKRMVFHEITPSAITKAVEETRDLDLRLVDAQEGRRFLDRLVGYEVSPVLWRAVDKARSAGRVQSVAIRLVCERERERMAFRSATWYDVTVTLRASETTFEATLETLNGVALATGKNFDALGALETKGPLTLLSDEAAHALAGALMGERLAVTSVTSTPRTDSTTLSDEAIRAARAHAASMFGDDYVADQPRRYDRKVKNAQEAHEAIRPAGESFRSLDDASSHLSGDERALYDLIWKRTIASQMVDARLTQDRVRLSGTLTNIEGIDGDVAVGLSASGLRIEFAGFRRAYVEGTDDPEAELADQERLLPTRRGRLGSGRQRRGEVPRHPAARPLLRGDVDQEVGGPRHWTTVDLRLGDEDDRPARLRLEEGEVSRADLSRVRGGQSPRALLRRPRRLSVHRRHGRSARRDCPRPSRPGAVAAQVLLRRRRGEQRVRATRSGAHDPRASRVRLRRHQLSAAR
jgi:DNA topoisomerase-1